MYLQSSDQLFCDDLSMDSEGVFLLEEFESKDEDRKLNESDFEGNTYHSIDNLSVNSSSYFLLN